MIRLARLGVLAAAVFVLALVELSVPAEAIAPVVVALGVFAGAATAAAVLALLRVASNQADLARQQYAQDAGAYAGTLEQIYNNYYTSSLSVIYEMHRELFNKTFAYYTRWAESIASSKCQKTSMIAYQDIAPVTNDLAQMYANYLQQVLNIVINAYRYAVAVAGIRHQAGIGIGASVGGITADYNGSIYTGSFAMINSGPLVQVRAVIIANGVRYVVATASSSSVSVDQSTIQKLFDPAYNVDDVDFVINTTLTQFSYRPAEITNILWTIKDFKYIAGAALANAQLYCNLMAVGLAAANIPPPSVALPFDLNTYNQLSPEDRYALYIAYMNQLANTNWSQVSSVLPNNVYISNTSGRIYGSVCLDPASAAYGMCNNYVVVPVTPTLPTQFAVGGYAPLAGTYAIVDPNTGRIVNIVNPSPLPVPQNYTIVWRSPGGRYALINWTDPSTGQTLQGVAVDTKGTGSYDAVYPYIQPQQIYQRDPRTGAVSNVNNITIGPTPTDQWSSNYGLSSPKPLSLIGGLGGIPRWAIYAALGFGALLLLIVALRR